MPSYDDKPSVPPEDVWLGANRTIASAMSFALPLWWVPGQLQTQDECSAVDASMARSLLAMFGREATDEIVRALVANFRRQYRPFEPPFRTPPAVRATQLLESYGLGRFVMICAQRGIDPREITATTHVLEEIEPELSDANRVVQFYETTLGARFPSNARESFAATVDALRTLIARPVVRVPRPSASETLGAPVAWAYWGKKLVN